MQWHLSDIKDCICFPHLNGRCKWVQLYKKIRSIHKVAGRDVHVFSADILTFNVAEPFSVKPAEQTEASWFILSEAAPLYPSRMYMEFQMPQNYQNHKILLKVTFYSLFRLSGKNL